VARFADEVEARGVRIAVVFCQGRKAVARWIAKQPWRWPFLCDEDRNVAKAWGVYHAIGIDALHTARPATFLIRKDGFVAAAYVGARQADQPGREWILPAIDRLRESAAGGGGGSRAPSSSSPTSKSRG
jgi:peroxiredoxin